MLVRKVVFLLTSLLLRYPAWAILFAVRPLKLFGYLFLVYPGTDKDLDGYCPRWLAKSLLFSGKPTIGGIITKGDSGIRGLVLVIPNTIQECMKKKSLCQNITQRLDKIAKLIGVNAIAIAGQGPSMIKRHGIITHEMFVSGYYGTVFAIAKTIEKIFKNGEVPIDALICVVGMGYVGARLMEFLQGNGHLVFAVDVGAIPQSISKADVVVVLTPKGEDFLPYIPHIKDGAIIVDDTHPRLRKKPQGKFYKVAVSLHNTVIIPRLPGYRAGWLPGCTIEALVVAKYGVEMFESQQHFNFAAENMGFYPLLVQ